MALASDSRHGMWSSRWLFILAAAGSAVGLGNIWKFPYITGENGGGAFVVIYLVCVALVGIPIMMSEVLLGREGRTSPITTMRTLAAEAGKSKAWTFIGWLGVLAGFFILSYYAVIAGWALNYIWVTASGTFEAASATVANDTFNEFLSDPWQLLFWHTLFMGFTVWIVGKGVSKGLETAIRWFMPMLFVLLIALVGYGFTSEGFDEGWAFMFDFNFDKVSPETWLIAMGQAFFTLSLGMGAMMAYGAYVPGSATIGTTVMIIALLDTVVAVCAGLAIFPVVFANGLEAAQGPSLMFVTVPLAFGQLPLGSVFGTVFFVLVSFAAITSAISLTEPALAYLVEEYNARRQRVAISLGVMCWLLGIGTVLSFNVWSEFYIVGNLTVFGFVDYVSQNVMLPLGGLLIAVFAAWFLPKKIANAQLGIGNSLVSALWRILAGIVAPLCVVMVFAYTLFPDAVNRLFGS